MTPCNRRCSRSRLARRTLPALESKEESKGSEVSKMAGKRKLRRAQSSCRLFWMGVPVRSSLCETRMARNVSDSLDCSFLRRCASSTTRKHQRSLRRADTSAATHSYVVTRTSKESAETCSSRIALRSSLLPCSRTARSLGHHRPSSFIQLPSTVRGTTTRWGRETFACNVRYARRAMDCSVLPSPISSARMPLSPRVCSEIIQFRPSS
mmetsp:Transcript_21798/g.70433  ORF Transcript_21798/g.70433 Transcript_21798/m.70433 type:complete len:209 (+) Transcript_21798:1071-1697(+)